MITEALFSFFGTLVHFALEVVPDSLGVPSWLEEAMNSAAGAFYLVRSLAVWIPVPVVMAAGVFRIAVLLGAVSVKFIRALVSLFTGGGGSSA